MPESTEDGIKINYPKYDLSDNFLESVREVFGNIKIDLDLNLDLILKHNPLKHNPTLLENISKDDELYILMTYPFYYKIIKKKSNEIFIKYNKSEYKYLDNYYIDESIDNFKKFSNYIGLKEKVEKARAKARAKARVRANVEEKATAKARAIAEWEYKNAEREYEDAKKEYEEAKNTNSQKIKFDTDKSNSYILFSYLNIFILINKYRILILEKKYKNVITKNYEINKDNITTKLINDNLNNFNNVFAFLDYKFLRKYLIYISYDKKEYIENSSSIAASKKVRRVGGINFSNELYFLKDKSSTDNKDKDNFLKSKYKYIMLAMCVILYNYDRETNDIAEATYYNKVILNILNNINLENIKLFKDIQDHFYHDINKYDFSNLNINDMKLKDRYNMLKKLIKKDFYFNLLYEFIKTNFIPTTGKINDITYDNDWTQYFKIIKNNMYSENINNKKITKLYEDYKIFLNKKIFSDDDDILINFKYLSNIDSINSHSPAPVAPATAAVPATDPSTDPAATAATAAATTSATTSATTAATAVAASPPVSYDIINNDKLSSRNLVKLFIISYKKKI